MAETLSVPSAAQPSGLTSAAGPGTADRPLGVVCPQCGKAGSAVINSRPGTHVIRRRRVCAQCTTRFTTYEVTFDPSIFTTQRSRAKMIAAQLRNMASALEVW